MNYSLLRELKSKIERDVEQDKNYNMIFKYIDKVSNGIKVKPGDLKKVRDNGCDHYLITGNDDRIDIYAGYNQHSNIIVSGNNKRAKLHLDSRMNWATVSSYVAKEEGNYYISQGVMQRMIKPAKSYKQVEYEVKRKMPNAPGYEQNREISKKYELEKEPRFEQKWTCEITFYDSESLSYFKGYDISDLGYVNYELSKYGIGPTNYVVFIVDTMNDMVDLLNQFYKKPDEFLNNYYFNQTQEIDKSSEIITHI